MFSWYKIFEFFNFKPKNFYPAVFKANWKKNKIAVALSGGVDSSVTLAILKSKGYDVIGVYFKTYKPDGDRTTCKKEGTDAKNICKILKVPFFAVDLQDEYKKYVFDYMIAEYKAGRTPNPDIYCNKFIKFGVFWKKAQELGADFLATGHYARHIIKNSKHFLAEGKDQNKDQTYFLSQISSKVLEKVIFPVGDFDKKEIRKMAKKFGLFTAEKKDSQGICFIQKEINLKDFLQNYIEQKKGDILNLNGEVVGSHDGVFFYTIGQRHGFEIDSKFKTPNQPKLFIVDKDIDNNTITVGTKEDLLKKNSASKKEIEINNLNFFASDIDWSDTENLFARIRHRGQKIKIEKIEKNNDKMKVFLKKAHSAVAEGQFMAIYKNEICLGGGEIVG